MDIATLSTVITKLQAEVNECRHMLDWAVAQPDPEHRKKFSESWSASLVQAKKAVAAVETMLENEIAYREHTTAVFEEAA